MIERYSKTSRTIRLLRSLHYGDDQNICAQTPLHTIADVGAGCREGLKRAQKDRCCNLHKWPDIARKEPVAWVANRKTIKIHFGHLRPMKTLIDITHFRSGCSSVESRLVESASLSDAFWIGRVWFDMSGRAPLSSMQNCDHVRLTAADLGGGNRSCRPQIS